MKSMLQEILKIDDSEIDMMVKPKKELSEKLWSNNKLNTNVRKTLLKIAQVYIEFLKLPKEVEVKDITLTGSLTNYNYTPFSDIDLHIIVDKSKFNMNDELRDDYLDSKKFIFNDKYDIVIYGHSVELYVQDYSEKHFSDGVYSVLNDSWIIEPEKETFVIDYDLLKRRVEKYSLIIDTLAKDPNLTPEKVDKLKDKIKKLRNSGLENEGKYSIENLTFKILRNNNYLDKLANLKIQLLNKEYSI